VFYAFVAVCALAFLLTVAAVFPIPLWISRALRGAPLAELERAPDERLAALPAPASSLVREIEIAHTILANNLPELADYGAVARVAPVLAGASSDGWIHSALERQGEAEGAILTALDSLLSEMDGVSADTRETLAQAGYAPSTLRDRWMQSRALMRRSDRPVDLNPGAAPGSREIKESIQRYEAAARDLEEIRASLLRVDDPYRA
jgi:hypothetical protein